MIEMDNSISIHLIIIIWLPWYFVLMSLCLCCYVCLCVVSFFLKKPAYGARDHKAGAVRKDALNEIRAYILKHLYQRQLHCAFINMHFILMQQVQSFI